jgi:para-nitrobenzyl esterase
MTETIAVTTTGPVRGISVGGVSRFLGVPYAAAPVGENRFAVPVAHAPWNEPRDATERGPNAPHAMRDFPALAITPLVGDGWRRGDDYLAINIWTPDEAAEPLPVMVFIHGGAFVAGSGDASVQDGSAFARSGVVLMSMNYRLGVEGFLPIEGAPTNLGLRDQLFALQWVRDNAAAFGGDPDNISVFGESAGAMTLACLVASPLAKGLFKRAIIESGHGSLVRSRPVADRLTRKVAKVLKIEPTVAGFRSRSVEDCLAALEEVQAPTASIDMRGPDRRDPAFGITKFLPVIGDDVLPDAPLDALAKGVGADIEVLIGTNVEEMNLYFVPTNVIGKINRWLAWFIVSKSEPKAREVLKAYGMGERGRRPGEAFTAALSDLVFRLPARRFAAAHQGRTHYYEFDWRSPACDGRLGACHGLELPFVFNTLAVCTGPLGVAGQDPPQDLADRVHGIWADYARDGRLPWDEYDAASRMVFSLARGDAARDPVLPVETI